MSDPVIQIERDGLRSMLQAVAVMRENDAQAAYDHRYAEAASSIRQIAATMDQVSDDMLVKLASVNEVSEGTLSSLMAARLVEVGFALPLCEDAATFFLPLVEQVDVILDRARSHMH